VLATVAPRALADTTSKPYAVDVAPHAVPAGSTRTFTVTLTNETGTQQLGSANLTAPRGLSILGAGAPSPVGTATVVGDMVQLRDLSTPPGSSATVSIDAIVPCPAGDFTWSVVAKQANNFSGDPGNDLTFDAANSDLVTSVTGACRLAFHPDAQPADAQVDLNITSERYVPTGAPVKVDVLDAAGNLITTSTAPVSLSILTNPGGGTLTASPTNAVGGVATFPSLSIDRTGLRYTLGATTTEAGIDPGASDPFDVVDVGKTCPSGPCQSGNVTSGSTTAAETASAGAVGDQLTLALSVEALDCPGYAELSAVVTFDVTGERTKTITITIPKTAGVSASARQVCFSSPTPFVDRSGATVNTGLLPDCTVAQAPCVVSKKVVKKTIVVTFATPAGDPRGRI